MFKKVSFAVLALLATSQAKNPGFGASITQEGVNNAKNVITPVIFKYLKDIQIPEIDISGGSFTNLDINIPQPALNDVNLLMDHAANGIELKAQNIAASTTSDFKFKYIITVNGQADIQIKNMSVDAKLGLSEQASAIAGEMAPKLEVQKLNININPDDVDIKLSGGSVAKIASVLIPIIKSSLLPTIVETIQTQVKTMIETTIDQDLVKYGTRVTIPYLAGVTFDYAQLLNGPTITSDNVLEAAMDGTFYDINAPEHYSITPAQFPLRNASGKTFQSYLTDYTLNTNFQAAYDTKNVLNITQILEKLKINVTTDQVGKAIPAILKKYGSGKTVSIKGAYVTAPSKVAFTGSQDSVEMNLMVSIGVGSDVAIQGQLDGMTIAGLLNGKNGALYGNVAKHTIGTLSNFQTTLGITADEFTTQFQGLVDSYAKQANTDLAAGVKIPTVFGISISDFELNSSNGYAEFGINVTPATWEGIASAWESYKVEFDRIEAGEYKTETWGDIEMQQLFLQ